MCTAVVGNFLLLEHVMTFSVVYAYSSRGYISAKMAALPANSRAESGLKPCFRFRPWNGFLRVPFHIFQTLFKQSFLGLSQRIVLIKPLIGLELSELETNLLPLFLSELGQFPAKSRLCSSLAFNRTARCCQDENWFVLSPLSSPAVGVV